MNEDDILVSYDVTVTAIFTNVTLDETIKILVDKAFTDDWFNKTYGLNLPLSSSCMAFSQACASIDFGDVSDKRPRVA